MVGPPLLSLGLPLKQQLSLVVLLLDLNFVISEIANCTAGPAQVQEKHWEAWS